MSLIPLISFPEIALLNTHELTHVKVRVLDLTFVTVALVEGIRWCVDETVTSDHCSTVITAGTGGLITLVRTII